MKRKLLLSSIILAGAFLLATNTYHSYPDNPPTGKTGAPGEGTCLDCHSGTNTSNSSSVTITFSGTNNTYEPGQTYTITVDVSAGVNRYGFQAIALNSSNGMAGSFTVTDGARTQIRTSGSKAYVSHKQGGTGATNQATSWSFDWTAPAAGTGDVTVYSSVLAANSNGTTSGDNLHLKSLTLSEATSTSVNDLSTENQVINLYPNPSTHLIQVNSEFNNIQIYNLNGQLLQQHNNLGTPITHNLPKGIYQVVLGGPNRSATTTLLVQ